MKTALTITNGPSREELFDALRLTVENRLILLEVECYGVKRYISAIVNSIQDGNGSGNLWNLTLKTDEKFLWQSFFMELPEIKKPGVYSSKKLDFCGIKNMIENEKEMGGGPTLQAYQIRKQVTIEAPLYSTKTREGMLIGETR